eukprot:6211886-Pleurochrysis_carterae.AAC.1
MCNNVNFTPSPRGHEYASCSEMKREKRKQKFFAFGQVESRQSCNAETCVRHRAQLKRSESKGVL